MSEDLKKDTVNDSLNDTEDDATVAAEPTSARPDGETAEATETADTTTVDGTGDAADTGEAPGTESAVEADTKRDIQWPRVVAFGVLPALALVLALGAGYLKWRDNSVRNSEIAAATSVQAAKDSTIALLSYKPETVEKQLGDARGLLTGDFQDSYTSLTNDVVIPGAKQKHISAVASVPAAASVSANPNEAVVLVFVNQTVTVGQDAPTDTASSVRVTLQKVDNRWLISKFDPV